MRNVTRSFFSRAIATFLLIAGGVLTAGLAGAGCRKEEPGAAAARRDAVDRQVRDKWQKPLAELPSVRLIAISPHNSNIKNEFEWAFSLYHAERFGSNVDIEWRDVGGGSGTILHYLRNVYTRSESSGIDIVWGGGDYNFRKLADEGMLMPLELGEETLANIPDVFGGLSMLDAEQLWCGAAVSGFGFLYNSVILDRLGIEPPRQWDDLAQSRFADLICLADPSQSGTAAVVYEMVVQSAPSWQDGWAKLLAILGNCCKFFDSSGAAAEAPGLGEAPVTTCIDFYGTMRVAGAPDKLVYISPQGQTAFSPDPIGVLKGAPNHDLGARFVEFVLSVRGQALWALPVGEPDGPIRNELGRQPIRRDVYTRYAGKLSPWVIDPYLSGEELQVDTEMLGVRFGVLRQLVRAAAIDNHKLLRAARRRVIETGFESERLAEFNSLPDDVRTREQIAILAKELRDPVQSELIVTGWVDFFRKKYERVAR